MVDLGHGNLGDLPEQGDNTVHDGANGSKVVEGDEGVHLEVGGAEQALNHGKTKGLKHDTSHLEKEADKDKVDFTKGGNNDTDDNGGDVEELLEVGLGDAERPAGDEDRDGGGGLEHLDKGDGEVEVGQVTANQTETEEETNGDDGAEVDAASHLDILTTIEDAGPAGEGLGNDGGKDQVVGGEDDGVGCRGIEH